MTFIIRLPGHIEATRYECGAPETFHPGRKYVVIAEFNKAPVLYPVLCATEFIPTEEQHATEAVASISSCNNDADKARYCGGLQRLIKILSKNGGKVVISRIKETHTTLDSSAIFWRLAKAYPEATVYSWDSGKDVWLGATPEVLLQVKNGQLTTMSLAGTRLAHTSSPWDEKNIEEQAIVTRFISDTLFALGMMPEIAGTEVLQAGPVEHLCTMITTKMHSLHSLLEVAEQLSPTPAVSGFPRDMALHEISSIEQHPREYYAGYFGIFTPDEAQLFVTLRCMKLSASGHARIFAGGGITPLSIPEEEWMETENKASTLLNLLN